MSPYCIFEGDGYREWDGRPKDIRDYEGKDLGVSVFKVVEDPEQIKIDVAAEGRSYVVGREREQVIFPGQNGTLNREGFDVIKASTRQVITTVVYRKEPIKDEGALPTTVYKGVPSGHRDGI